MAPSRKENEKYVAHLKEQYIPKKVLKTASKSTHRPSHNTCYRQDAAKTAGIVFTHRPKIRIFAPQGRLVAQIPVKLCRTDGHLGPLGSAKFDVNRCRQVGMRPQNIKNFHFLVKSRPAGATPLTDFRNF